MEMYVTFGKILEDSNFRDAEVIGGREGLSNIVERISVFDCTYDDVVENMDIIRKGDLFITCLEQFTPHTRQSAVDFFRIIIGQGSSGLFIVGDRGMANFDGEIMELCDSMNFPVVHVPLDMPYALIMDIVNQYISFDNVNALNALKLERILYSSEQSDRELEILTSIKSSICDYIAVNYVSGEYSSEITRMNLYMKFLRDRRDIYVLDNGQSVFITSEKEPKLLERHRQVVAEFIGDCIPGGFVGQSRIYRRKDIRSALWEAKQALIVAERLDMHNQMYNPLNTIHLLLPLRDSKWADEYYKAYVDAISSDTSSEMLPDILKTIEIYVAQSGDFAKTAELLTQHENTIRYRVNKVKRSLGMEKDTIKFYETIAVATKLRILLGK